MISFADPDTCLDHPNAPTVRGLNRMISAGKRRAAAKLRLVIDGGVERLDCSVFAVVSHQPGVAPTLLALVPEHDLADVWHLMQDAAPVELAKIEIEYADQQPPAAKPKRRR